jgi:hypothetical protein
VLVTKSDLSVASRVNEVLSFVGSRAEGCDSREVIFCNNIAYNGANWAFGSPCLGYSKCNRMKIILEANKNYASSGRDMSYAFRATF